MRPKPRHFQQAEKTKPNLRLQKAPAPAWEHLITLTMASKAEKPRKPGEPCNQKPTEEALA